jgi:hypothetical protein
MIMQHLSLVRHRPCPDLAGAASAGRTHSWAIRAGAAAAFILQWPGSGFEAKFTGQQLTATIDDWGQLAQQ